jgi:hypothetical protein
MVVERRAQAGVTGRIDRDGDAREALAVTHLKDIGASCRSSSRSAPKPLIRKGKRGLPTGLVDNIVQMLPAGALTR